MIPDKLNQQINAQMADTRAQALLSASMPPVKSDCADGTCQTPAKRTHGGHWTYEQNVPSDMVPLDPHGSGFNKGDVVTFTNDYGSVFNGMTVRGFAKEKHSAEFTPRWVYILKDSWWFPVSPHTLKLEVFKA